MRNTIEKIEKIGIKRSIEQIAKSDLIIKCCWSNTRRWWIWWINCKWSKKEMKFYLKVHNKSDLIKTKNINGIYVLLLNSDIKELEDALIENFKDIDIMDERIFSNTRQLSLIKMHLILLKKLRIH
ncbi:hypothetical protein NWP96_07160 [Mycoplasmopsis cynos]|nr:hypothetical protein [Mycoplasmopsis cynos]